MLKVMDQRTGKGMMETILYITHSLTLAEALELLESIDTRYVEDELWSPGMRIFTLNDLGLAEMLMPCSRLGPYWFYGGPPGKYEWVRGLACQFVADRLMRAVARYGTEFVGAKLDAMLRRGAP